MMWIDKWYDALHFIPDMLMHCNCDSMKIMLVALLIILLVLDLAVFVRLYKRFHLMNVTPIELPSRNELPTVSICITARNEKHAMTQCLEYVVASDYPKLEIIVLDDGSRDDTSLLIKSFAHAGVRFVEGKQLPVGWLGKNFAQTILANEASGKYIFFIDVDTLIEQHTVSRLVGLLSSRQLKMLSVIPVRNDHWHLSTLFTTMRHFWAIMRHSPKSPRATSNAWMIERELLLNEFKNDSSLPLSIKVETSIAKKLNRDNEYMLIMSNRWVGIRYEKRWSSQVETSIRVLFPQCHKRWLEAFGIGSLLALALLPYILVSFYPVFLLILLIHFAVAFYYLRHVWERYTIAGAFLLPVTLAQEFVLIFVSAYRYTFGTITWKGRPITTSK